MRTPRNENLILQAADGYRHTVGSIVVKHGTVYFKAWANFARHERRDSHAIGVNAAILAHLDACRVTKVYLLDTASKRIYGTTVATLRRLGSTHRHVDRVKGGGSRDWGVNFNLPIERWDRVPWFDLGYVPPGSEWVIEAVPAREDEAATLESSTFANSFEARKQELSPEPAQLGLFDARVA